MHAGAGLVHPSRPAASCRCPPAAMATQIILPPPRCSGSMEVGSWQEVEWLKITVVVDNITDMLSGERLVPVAGACGSGLRQRSIPLTCAIVRGEGACSPTAPENHQVGNWALLTN